jgi:hypothetical protein
MAMNLGAFTPSATADTRISDAIQCVTIVVANRTLIDYDVFLGQSSQGGTFIGHLPGQVTDRFDVGNIQGWSGNLCLHPVGGSIVLGTSPSMLYCTGYQSGDTVGGQYPSFNGNQVQQVSANDITIGSMRLLTNLTTPLFYSYFILDNLPVNSEAPASAYIKLQQNGAVGSGLVDMLIHQATLGNMTIDSGGAVVLQSGSGALQLKSIASNVNIQANAGQVNVQSSGSNGISFDSAGLFSFLNANSNLVLHGIKHSGTIAGASPITYAHGLGISPIFVAAVTQGGAAGSWNVNWNNVNVVINYGGAAQTFDLLIFY